jgi:uncharacterized protein (TIRG00374 family)
LIIYLVRSGHLDLKMVWNLMTFQNVVLALILAGLNLLVAAWRWIILLKARNLNIPFGYGISLYLIGTFFNYALPGAVSGDLVRGYYLVQDYPGRKMDSALSVLIDRILGLYSFFILTLLAVAFDLEFVMQHENIRWVATLALLIFLGMTAFFLLGFSKTLYSRLGFQFVIEKIGPLHRVMEGFQRFGGAPLILLLSILVSLLAQVLTMTFFYQVTVLTGESDITWKAILFAVPMGFVVSAVPIAPAGVGVGQVAFLYLFQTYVGRPTSYGAVAITAFQLANAVLAMFGAIFYVRRRKPHELDNLDAKMESAVT